jgi:hypothetical protein
MATETTVAAPPASAPPAPDAVAAPSDSVIHVTPPSTVETAPAPKPGSAKARLFNELRKRSNIPLDSPEAVAAPPARTPEAAAAPSDNGDEIEPVTPAVTTKPADKQKVSPWKLVDEWKKRAAEAEAKIAEVTRSVPSEAQRKAQEEEVQRREARLKELEDEIRYVNYEKSEEFKQKYKEPYDKAWSRAMNELNGITLTDASGNTREIQPQDLLKLVNMSLGEARDLADQQFGSLSNDVMLHRKEIANLFEAQQAAIEEAKKTGSTREQKIIEQAQQMRQHLVREVGESWQKYNEAAAKNEKYGKFFTPTEGDKEGNERLEKGFALVDKAFSENPFDPNLKPEQRSEIVRRQTAVRNRAAAFGRLVSQLNKYESKIAELSKSLEQFKGSTPPTGGGSAPSTSPVHTSAKASLFEALHKIAK